MDLRVTAEAAAVIEAARSRARRLDHATVDVEHLLAEVAATPDGRKLLVARGVNPWLLGAAVDARLATMPSRGGAAGYRAGSAPELSSHARRVLSRVAPPRWFGARPAGPLEVLGALLASPPAESLVADAEVDAGAIERLVDAAALVARSMLHRNVLVPHALLALLDEPGLAPAFSKAVGTAGLDPGTLRDGIGQVLTPGFTGVALASLGTLVGQAMAHATALRTTDRVLSPVPVVVRWLRDPAMQAVFDAVSLDRFEVLFALAHGVAFAADVDGAGEPVAVALHDDDHTTMEFVVEILTSCFDLEGEGARSLMLRVHEERAATVAKYPAADNS